MKKIKYILFVLIISFAFTMNVSAGSLSVWASANSIGVGDSVTISVNAKNIFGTFNISVSDASILSGANSGNIDNDTGTYTFTANKTGTVTISIVPADMADYDTEAPYNETKSVTIQVVDKNTGSSSRNNTHTITEAKEYSSDNNLKNLDVEGYTLNPVFNQETTEYKLEVDEKVTKVNIIAEVNDNKATVSGAGEANLSAGSNTIQVKVTAENGNEKIYNINIEVIDKNPISVNVSKGKYTLVKSNNGLLEPIPDYEETTISIDGQDVLAYKNAKNKLTLVILKDNNNKYAYYIYDKGEYILYKECNFGNIKLMILDMPKKMIPDEYKKYTFKYDKTNYIGYKLNKNNSFYLIYAMDLSNGKKDLYFYDNKSNSVVLYDKNIAKFYKEKYNSEIKMYQIIILSLIGLFLLGSIVIIIYSLTKKNNKRRKK